MSTMDENSFPRITIRVRNAVSYRAAVPFDVSGILAAYLSPPLHATHFSSHFILFSPLFTLVRPLYRPLFLYLDDISEHFLLF